MNVADPPPPTGQEPPLPKLDAGAPSLTAMETDARAAIEFAREYAALSGPFAPGDALRAAGADQPLDLAVTVSAALAAACDTGAGKAGAWLLRASERAWDLKRLADRDLLEAAKRWRRDLGMDAATSDLLDALDGEGEFSTAAVEARLSAAEAGSGEPAPDLPRLAAALEWSGAFAPAAALLARVQAALSRADQRRRGDLLLEDGFHGRADMSETLVDWICAPEDPGWAVRALYVSGLPAIGKSTLLEHALREVAGRGVGVVVARLDFDRASLDVLDRLGLSLEVARQVASQAPEIAAELRSARLEAVTTQEVAFKGGGRRRLPYALIEAISAHLRNAGSRLVIVLDTLEVLRGRGETHPGQLFDWLDELRGAGLGPLVVIGAGRGDALLPVQDRVAVPLTLDRLTETDAAALLAQTGTPPDLWGQVIQLADGDPMQLRLLSAVARRDGAPGLDREEGATATLYRSLESRLGGRHGKIARFIPLFRRFDSRLLGEVIAPVVGRGRLSPADAAELWDGLKEQTWLIGGQAASGWLEPHPDLRRRLAHRLYEERSRSARDLHERAARWFARRDEPWAATESLYHRLQATRWERGDDALRGMNLEAGFAFEPGDLEDLPAPARDAVLRARGERSYEGRDHAAAPAGPVSAEAAGELRALIGRGDLAEAMAFYDHVFQSAAIDPVGEAADAALVLLWRTGRWREARRLADERAWSRPWDDALFDIWPEAALVRLEMRAEFRFADLRRWFGQAEGHVLERTTRLITGSKTNLAYGALGFAMPTWRLSRGRGDAASAMRALWTPGAAEDDLRTALLVALERRRSVDPKGTAQEPAFLSRTQSAQTLAILSPYADLAEWLLRDRRDGRLQALLNAQVEALPELAGVRHNPAAPATTLSALGLTAEWLSAAGLLLRDPDLRAIGRSAERWRRAAGGWWPYSRPPHDWQGEAGLDVVTEERLAELFDSGWPLDAARERLAAWAGGEARAERVLRAARLDQLRDDLAREPAEASHVFALRAASRLSRRWIPAAFVPALAILAIEPRRDA